MSQLSRILSLSSRLCSRRSPIAAYVRPVAVIQQPPLRYAARIANPVSDAIPRRLPLDDATQLKEALRLLNEQVQRSGRIVYITVEEAISYAERMGSVSGVETQLLLRATGSFLKDKRPSEREALTERVWKLTPKERLDISHYNTLLHVKLENGVEFDPSSFLQELSDAKIAPNRVTYQRLVQRYCEMGDIQNATKIIEFMKSQNVAITEKVFHSLIVGHFKAGDPEAARNILEVMQNATLRPSAETYTVLAEGLAEMGDSKGALEILSKRQFLDEQTLRIVKALALRDDFESVEHAMTLLSDATINFSNVNSICIELLVAGKLDMAIKVFKTGHMRSMRQDSSSMLVIYAARSGYSASDVLRICEELKDEGVEESIFVEATKIVVESGNKALSEDYIQKMRDLGLPIRAHYFLPFLCAAKNEAGVLSELKEITSLETPTYELIIDFVLPRVDTSDLGRLHGKLIEAGVPSNVISDAVVRHLLKSGRLADAEKVLLNFDVSKTGGLTSLLGIAMSKTEDTTTAVRILKLLVERGDPRSEMVAKFIESSGRMVSRAIEAISETDLPISLKSFNRLSAAGLNMDPLSKQVVDVSEPRRMEDYDFERPTEELEALLVEAEATNKDTSRLLKKLLIDYCKQNQAEKIEEVLRKLPAQLMTGANLSFLVEYFTRQNDAERALYYLEQALDRNIIINPYRVLGLAKLFVSQKRLFEASELLEKTSSNFSLSIENLPIDSSAGFLLTCIYENYGKDTALNFFEKYISKHTNARPLGVPLRHLIDLNIVEAFELFKEIVQKYKSAPCRRYLCKKLIQENRTEELETMRDLMENLFGKVDYAADMVVCYLECNKRDEARDMLFYCVGRRGKANLVRTCNAYFTEDNVEKLNALLELMEEVGVEKSVAYLYRIKQYNRENNVAAALEVWTQAQEDNVSLQPAALEILAELLGRNGQPIPFVIPERADDFIGGMGKPSGFREILDRSLEEALEHRQKLKAESKELKDDDLTALLLEMINRNMIKEAMVVAGDIEDIQNSKERTRYVIGRLMNAAASNGMIDELEAFVESSGGIGRGPLQRAYQDAGRLDEYLTKLESRPLDEVRFSITKEAMESDPAIAARIEKLAHRLAAEESNYSKLADLWYLHILNSELDKAVELQKKYPEMLETLHRFRVLPSLRKWFDRDFFERLLQVTDSPKIRSRALLSLVLELLSKRNVAEAQSCFNFGTSLGIDTSYFPAWLPEKLRDSTPASDRTSDFASESQSPREEVETRMA